MIDRREFVAGVASVATATALPRGASAQETQIVIQRLSDSRSFDPHKIISRPVGESLPLLLDTLVVVEDDMKTLHDGLAESWKVSEDGLKYTFLLKNDLKFFDGKALTAQSVEASFRRWTDPATKANNLILLGPLDQVNTLDPRTVEFTLKEPYPEFLLRLAQPYCGIIDADEAKSAGESFGVTQMNASGPYGWGRWRPRDEQVLVRNPNYRWGSSMYANRGPVKPDKVVFKVIPEDNTRVASMLSGASDISYYLPRETFGTIRKDKRFELGEPRAYGWVFFLAIKMHRPLMEPAVRKAMNFAVDRAAMVDAFYSGEADPAFSAVSPKFDGYNKAIEGKLPKYDPAAARKILDDAGWKLGAGGVRVRNGVKLAPVLIGWSYDRAILEAFQAMMADVGIDLKVDVAEASVMGSRVMTKDDFDLHGYYGSYSTLGELFEKYFLTSEPISVYRADKEQGKVLDEIVKSARRELDQKKRNELFAQVQDYVAENNLWVPLIHERMIVVSNKEKVTGVRPHGITGNGLYKALDLAPVRS